MPRWIVSDDGDIVDDTKADGKKKQQRQRHRRGHPAADTTDHAQVDAKAKRRHRHDGQNARRAAQRDYGNVRQYGERTQRCQNLVAEPWRTDVMKLIVAPDHAFAMAGEPVDPKRIENEILIVREPGSGSREVVAQALAAHGIEPLRTLEIGSTAAIKQVVAAGLGVSIVSVVTVDDQVRLGRLKVLDLGGMTIERTLWQLTLPGRVAVPAARAFEKMLLDRSASAG
jgi:DNA-binding transcriptional LysR family regulator